MWQPAALALTAEGWTRTTCAPPTVAPTAHDVPDAFVAGLPSGDDRVLVAQQRRRLHPPITSQHRSIIGAVVVDAVLPPRRGQVALAPPAFLELLRLWRTPRACSPWTDWWEEAEVAASFHDDELRYRIEREQARLPLSYFEDQLPVPEGWADRPAAILAFVDTYGRERDEAERRRWPVTTLSGRAPAPAERPSTSRGRAHRSAGPPWLQLDPPLTCLPQQDPHVRRPRSLRRPPRRSRRRHRGSERRLAHWFSKWCIDLA